MALGAYAPRASGPNPTGANREQPQEERMEPSDERITTEVLGVLDGEIKRRAQHSILLLPDNWPYGDHEPVYASTTDSIAKLFAQNGIRAEILDNIDGSTALRDNRSVVWVAPTLLITGLMLSQNPLAASLAISMIANYVTDIFKGLEDDPVVNVKVVESVSAEGTARRIFYQGPVSGLSELSSLLSRDSAEK